MSALSLKKIDELMADGAWGPSDLISYKITNLDPLQIDESVSGSGTHPPTHTHARACAETDGEREMERS